VLRGKVTYDIFSSVSRLRCVSMFSLVPKLVHKGTSEKLAQNISSQPQVRISVFNPLTPNDHYSSRTASLTSKRSMLYIYSTNTGTEYFKHGIYSPFFLFKMQFVS